MAVILAGKKILQEVKVTTGFFALTSTILIKLICLIS